MIWKKATINPINEKDNKCIHFAVTVALNHEEIQKDLQGLTNIYPFINEYKWEGIHFPSEKYDWKKIEENNVTNAFNVLYAKKHPAYVSKHDSNREKQFIYLIISKGAKNSNLSPKDDYNIILQ